MPSPWVQRALTATLPAKSLDTLAPAGRWVRVCQDCWSVLFPSEYLPASASFDTCSQCGYDSICTSVNPNDIPKES
jgi:hypothetical protein